VLLVQCVDDLALKEVGCARRPRGRVAVRRFDTVHAKAPRRQMTPPIILWKTFVMWCETCIVFEDQHQIYLVYLRPSYRHPCRGPFSRRCASGCREDLPRRSQSSRTSRRTFVPLSESQITLANGYPKVVPGDVEERQKCDLSQLASPLSPGIPPLQPPKQSAASAADSSPPSGRCNCTSAKPGCGT